jgi:hypothetical protein
MHPLRKMDLVEALPGGPDLCERGVFDCMGPLPRAHRYRRRTRFGEVLVLQLARLTAPRLFGSPWVGQPRARAAPAASYISLLLTPGCSPCNHRRPLAPENMQVLEVSFEALSAMISGPF